MKGPDSKDVEMPCVIGVDIVSEKWQRRKALTGFAICVALLYNILSQMTLFIKNIINEITHLVISEFSLAYEILIGHLGGHNHCQIN